MTPSQIPSEISKIAAQSFSPAHLPPEISQIAESTEPFYLGAVVGLVMILCLLYCLFETLLEDRQREARMFEQQVLANYYERLRKEKEERQKEILEGSGESGICARCENIFVYYRLKMMRYGENRNETDLFCESCRSAVERSW